MPPVPWRALAIGAVVVVIVLGAAAALLIPSVTDDKREAAERDRKAAAQRHADLLATADREQRPRTGTGARDPVRAADAARVAARSALVAAAGRAVAADARERTGDAIDDAECDPFPRAPGRPPPAEQLTRGAAAYQCVAVTSRFDKGVIGIPFRLVVRFSEGRYAFCRIVPLGDRDRLTHPLPSACRL